MRRKRITHLLMPPAVILILMMFFITACEADFLDSTENQQFSLQQAKEYSSQGGSEIDKIKWSSLKYEKVIFGISAMSNNSKNKGIFSR